MKIQGTSIGEMDRRITIEQKVVTRDADYGTEVITWLLLATVWANVQDVLPSKSDDVKNGLALATNRTRIRFRYRSDVNSSMRILVHGASGAADRVMQIVGGPAEIGRRERTEVVCEEFSS